MGCDPVAAGMRHKRRNSRRRFDGHKVAVAVNPEPHASAGRRPPGRPSPGTGQRPPSDWVAHWCAQCPHSTEPLNLIPKKLSRPTLSSYLLSAAKRRPYAKNILPSKLISGLNHSGYHIQAFRRLGRVFGQTSRANLGLESAIPMQTSVVTGPNLSLLLSSKIHFGYSVKRCLTTFKQTRRFRLQLSQFLTFRD